MLSRLGNNRRKKRFAQDEDPLAGLFGDSQDTEDKDSEKPTEEKPEEPAQTDNDFDWVQEFRNLEQGFPTTQNDPYETKTGNYSIWLTKSEDGIRAGAKSADGKILFDYKNDEFKIRDESLKESKSFNDLKFWLRSIQ